jgi:hypothetical protein
MAPATGLEPVTPRVSFRGFLAVGPGGFARGPPWTRHSARRTRPAEPGGIVRRVQELYPHGPSSPERPANPPSIAPPASSGSPGIPERSTPRTLPRGVPDHRGRTAAAVPERLPRPRLGRDGHSRCWCARGSNAKPCCASTTSSRWGSVAFVNAVDAVGGVQSHTEHLGPRLCSKMGIPRGRQAHR